MVVVVTPSSEGTNDMISFKKKSRIGNIRARTELAGKNDNDANGDTGISYRKDSDICEDSGDDDGGDGDDDDDTDLKDVIRLEQQLRKRKIGVMMTSKGVVVDKSSTTTKRSKDSNTAATIATDEMIASSLPAAMQKHQNIMENYINTKLSINSSSSSAQSNVGERKSLLEIASESLYKLPSNLRVESSGSRGSGGNGINGIDVVATDLGEGEGVTSIVAGLVEVELPQHFKRDNYDNTLKAVEGMSAHQLRNNATRNDWKVMQKYRNMVNKKR